MENTKKLHNQFRSHLLPAERGRGSKNRLALKKRLNKASQPALNQRFGFRRQQRPLTGHDKLYTGSCAVIAFGIHIPFI
jgi:hypothetical protein